MVKHALLALLTPRVPGYRDGRVPVAGRPGPRRRAHLRVVPVLEPGPGAELRAGRRRPPHPILHAAPPRLTRPRHVVAFIFCILSAVS